MSVQKQSEIATNFTNKLLNLISKTNKELQKIDGNSWISDIDIIYQLSHLSHLWETPESISLKVSVQILL